jgi:hypothetical protein
VLGRAVLVPRGLAPQEPTSLGLEYPRQALLVPHVGYRPNEAESVILLHKSKRTGCSLCKKDLHLQR